MSIGLFVAAYILTVLCCACCNKNKSNLIDCCVISAAAEPGLFSVIGTALGRLNQYSVNRCLIILLISLLTGYVVLKISGCKPKFECEIKQRHAIAGVLVIFLLSGIFLLKGIILNTDCLLGKSQFQGMWLSVPYQKRQAAYEYFTKYQSVFLQNDSMIQAAQLAQSANGILPCVISLGAVLFGQVDSLLIFVPVILGVLYGGAVAVRKYVGKRKMITGLLFCMIICFALFLKVRSGALKQAEEFRSFSQKITTSDIVCLQDNAAQWYFNATAYFPAEIILTEADFDNFNDDVLYRDGHKIIIGQQEEKFIVNNEFLKIQNGQTEKETFYRTMWGILYVILFLGAVWVILKIAGECDFEKVLYGIGITSVWVFAVYYILNGQQDIRWNNIIIAGGALLGCAFGMALFAKKIDIIKLIVLSVIQFIFLYIISSACLIGINRFSIGMAEICTLIISLVIAVWLYYIRRQQPQITFSIKESIVPVIISLIAIPLILYPFGMYGMDQDEGVYQVKALGYILGYNDNYYNFEEYEKLDGGQQTEYEDLLFDNVAGFNFALEKENVEDYQGIAGTFHGIHTYSALLALTGVIAGYKNMSILGSMVLVLNIFLLWYTMENLKINHTFKILGTVVYALSPIILWQSKSTLVEIVAALIVLVYLYIMTLPDKEQCWLAWIPIVIFSVMHITVYVFMPMFILIFWFLFFYSGNRRYMLASILSVTGYWCGFQMMYHSSMPYTQGNYKQLYIGPVNAENIEIFVSIVCITAVVCTVVFMDVPWKRIKLTEKFVNTAIRIAAAAGMAGVIYVFWHKHFPATYLTVYSYLLSSAYIFFTAIILTMVFKPMVFAENEHRIVLLGIFLYSVIIFSIGFIWELAYYYYYGRYTVPYISVVIILGAVCLSEFQKTEGGSFLKKGCAVFIGVFLIVMFPCISTVVSQQDQTRVQWQTMQKVAEKIPENAAVIVSEKTAMVMMVPLKMLTGADVYIQKGTQLDIYKDISSYYEEIYVVGFDTDYSESDSLNTIYTGTEKGQEDVTVPDGVKCTSAADLIPYGRDFQVKWHTIRLYRWKQA